MAGMTTSIVPEGFVRSKKNATGTTLAKGVCVILDSTEDQIKLPAATTDHIYGVTMNAIPTGDWGDVQIMGKAQCLALGALATPGILVMSDATGAVTTWAAGGGTNAQVVGILDGTASGAGVLVEVELAGPGVIKQG